MADEGLWITGRKRRKVLAFIMAGGKGERLYPLTRDRAKPAVPFGGIYRIIDFTLSNCVNSGVRRVYVLTQYKSISLTRHIRDAWSVLNPELGEFIDAVPAQQRVDESWYRGTADAVYQNIYSIEMEKPQPDFILVLAGDHIYKMNYQYLINYHVEKKADATVGVVQMEREKSTDMGVVEVDGESRIVGFEEKPDQPKCIPGSEKHSLVSMGIYVFNKDVLAEELTEDARKSSDHDFGRNIIPSMIGRRRIFAYNFRGQDGRHAYWRDIGNLDAYYDANMDLGRVTPEFNLYDSSWPIRTYHPQYPPAKMVFAGGEDKERVGMALDSLVCPGTIISGGRVKGSIVSHNVRINSYAEVLESVIMERVEVGRYARIKKAIIDKDVKIGERMHIGYDLEKDRRRFTVTPGGVVVIPKGEIVSE